MPIQRVTETTISVLGCLLEATEPVWGLALVKLSGLKSGTVYPILDRLETDGWVSSVWEESNERSGPRRRFYVLTEEGHRCAPELVEKFAVKKVARDKPAKIAQKLPVAE